MGLFDDFFSWETLLFGPSTTALLKGDPVAVSPATKFATTGDSSSGPGGYYTDTLGGGLTEENQALLRKYEEDIRKGNEGKLSGGVDDRAKEALKNFQTELRLKQDEQEQKNKKAYEESQVALRAASRRRAREFSSSGGRRARVGGTPSLMGSSGGYTPTLMGR
jgi:hypothetical protein